LWSWVAMWLWPAEWPTISIQQTVLLFDTEPWLGVSGACHGIKTL
jgi:hypothetical protein